MASLLEYAFSEPTAVADKAATPSKQQAPSKMSIIDELYELCEANKALGETGYSSPRAVAAAIPDLSGRKRSLEEEATGESAPKSKLRFCKPEPLIQPGGAGGDASLAAVCSSFSLDELTEPVTPPHSATTPSLSICNSVVPTHKANAPNRSDQAKVSDYMQIPSTISTTATPAHKEEVTLASPAATTVDVGDDFTSFKLEESMASQGRHKMEPLDEESVKKCGVPTAQVSLPSPTREEAAIRRRARKELRNRKGIKSEMASGDQDSSQGSSSPQYSTAPEDVDKKHARAIRNREAALRSRMEAKAKMLSLERDNGSLNAKVQLLKAENLRLKQQLSGLAREMISSSNKNFTSLKDFFKSFEGL